MGKKTRMPGGAVGRRTILQLSPPGHRSGNTGEREEAASGSDDEQDGDGHRFVKRTMKAPTVKATQGLSLLGAYEDSDEDDAGNRSTASSQNNQSADIDSTLANFMAEIDAITTQPSTEEGEAQSSVLKATPPRPEVKAQQPAAEDGQHQQSAEFEYNTQNSLAGVGVEMGDWQEVWDENSGCYYYWNTQSNEVSWELPHYLADQVQSLEHHSNSSNGTAGYFAEENGAQTAPKETKVKDVMESIVGLTSEEEERHGVAASLLGPLIPSEVKEAEEKWRKRLLKSVDEADNSLDSEGEIAKPADSPSSLLESDLVIVAEKEVCAKKLSGDVSDAEEGPEEDTVELELALERKKAELRALEEGDGSAGGSSPTSEASQDATGSRSLQTKKNRWKTVFPCVGSPDSNSRSSDMQDNTETAVPKEEGDDKEAGGSEDTIVSKVPIKEEVETPELKFQIGQLANTLTSKMEFLGINKKTLSNFHLLLLQTETRIADWREGALNGVYLRRKLQEAAEHIKYYELNAIPKGWSCHWDREHRRYFYVKDQTGDSQWEFPTEEIKEEEHQGSPCPETLVQDDAKTSGSADESYPNLPTAPPPPLQPSTNAFWAPTQPPLPDSPPPPSHNPPPPPLPPESPPPPPPPPESDGEIMEVEMEMDDDNDDEPPAPGTEDGSGHIISDKITDSSNSLGKGQKRKAGQMNKTITIGSSPILYTQPALTTGLALSAVPQIAATAYWGVPAVTASLVPCEPPAPPVPAPPPQPPLPPAQPAQPPVPKAPPVDKTKKSKKEKSKKSKTKMPSLVKKWQSIQKELDEEEKSSSSDEDREIVAKKSIEDWKHQQLLTGKASKNANFEALPEDWRERIKKRKMMNST